MGAFSLIEAIVVLTIVSLSITFGTTIYADYSNKAKVAEAIMVMEQYQAEAVRLFAKYDEIDPFLVLFPDGYTGSGSGYIYGSSGNSSAKTVNLEYIQNLIAYSVTNSGNTTIVIESKMNSTYGIDGSTNSIYLAGVRNATTGELTWLCGHRTGGLNVNINYLPSSCRDTGLP